ncbi:MAG TPA: hypothetical protein VFO40_17020, partial [Chthoniobacterales bacterium]|nr:hypothetical protein [Chthoniobacterales bacterium]
MPGTTSGAFSAQVQQASDDLDGVHKCDHTRGVDTEQLDDGTVHTFVWTGRQGDALSVLPLLGFVPFDLHYLLASHHSRTDTKVQWTRTYGVAHPSVGMMRGTTAEPSGEELAMKTIL